MFDRPSAGRRWRDHKQIAATLQNANSNEHEFSPFYLPFKHIMRAHLIGARLRHFTRRGSLRGEGEMAVPDVWLLYLERSLPLLERCTFV